MAFFFVSAAFKSVSRFSRRRRNRGGRTRRRHDNEAQERTKKEAEEEINKYVQIISRIWRGLDKLKLGNVVIEYRISGFIKDKGQKGKRTGPDFKRRIGGLRLREKHTKCKIECYSYRGYRFKTDHDRSQGKGIRKIIR